MDDLFQIVFFIVCFPSAHTGGAATKLPFELANHRQSCRLSFQTQSRPPRSPSESRDSLLDGKI